MHSALRTNYHRAVLPDTGSPLQRTDIFQLVTQEALISRYLHYIASVPPFMDIVGRRLRHAMEMRRA